MEFYKLLKSGYCGLIGVLLAQIEALRECFDEQVLVFQIPENKIFIFLFISFRQDNSQSRNSNKLLNQGLLEVIFHLTRKRKDFCFLEEKSIPIHKCPFSEADFLAGGADAGEEGEKHQHQKKESADGVAVTDEGNLILVGDDGEKDLRQRHVAEQQKDDTPETGFDDDGDNAETENLGLLGGGSFLGRTFGLCFHGDSS